MNGTATRTRFTPPNPLNPPRLLALAVSAALATGTGAAMARQLEEVVVTAQKRQESLQDVPISMAVVGAEELSELNIFDFTETARLTPGVALFPGVQTAAIRLRGVGPAAYALTSPQSVAVFIDDIAQGSVGAAFATLVDVERLELLRGPQGTLYGQNAPGGAYNITTRAPNPTEYEGYIETSYGQQERSSLESIDIRGAYNIPLVEDVAALRLAGVYAESDGFLKIKNDVNPNDSTGGKEHQAIRARFLWNINDDMELLWTSNYQDLRDHGVDFNVEGFVPGTGGDNPIPAIYNKFKDQIYYGDFRSKGETDIVDTAFHFKWDAGWTNIDLLASWQDFKTHNIDNRAPYPGFNSRFDIQLDWETRTAELRFSDSGDVIDYIGGFYHAKRDIDGFFDVQLSGVNLLGPAIGAGDINAAFVNLTWHITDQWDLTGGARYDKNEIWTESNFEFLGFNSVVDDDVSYADWSWSIKLRHFLNENTTTYLAIDSARKQGGFNNLIPGLLVLSEIFPQYEDIALQMLRFDEEYSTSFEVGIKGNALDGRLSYSAALFYQEFEDHQIMQPGGVEFLKTPAGDFNSLFANQLTNADEVLTKGVEFEIAYLLGENWDLSWRLSYFDATIERWDYRFCGAGEEESPDQLLCPKGGGDPLNSLPPLNSNLQLGVVQPLSPTMGFYGRLNWSLQSPPNFTRETHDYAETKNIIGLTLGIRSESTGLDVRLWGKNLLDEVLVIDPTLRSDGDESLPQPFSGRYYPGREYGLTVSYDF